MYTEHDLDLVRFKDSNAFVQTDVSGGDMPVGEEEEEGWPTSTSTDV